MSKAKLTEQQNSLEFSYSEIIRIAIREQLKAKLSGDDALLKDLVAEEEKIQAERREARRMAMIASLTDDRIKKLTGDLANHVKKARKLLEDLRRTQKVLEKVKEAAELATSIVSTVAKIV